VWYEKSWGDGPRATWVVGSRIVSSIFSESGRCGRLETIDWLKAECTALRAGDGHLSGLTALMYNLLQAAERLDAGGFISVRKGSR